MISYRNNLKLRNALLLITVFVLMLPTGTAVFLSKCPQERLIATHNIEFPKDSKCSLADTELSGAIQIAADNIILDCRGSSLTGPGWGYGIYNSGFNNVLIRNCEILNYDTGIYSEDVRGMRVEDSLVKDNEKGIEFAGKSIMNSVSRTIATENKFAGFKFGRLAVDNVINWGMIRYNSNYDLYSMNKLLTLNLVNTELCNNTLLGTECKVSKLVEASPEKVIIPLPPITEPKVIPWCNAEVEPNCDI